MKKNRITEIIIATILIVSIASSYKYYIGDKKNQNTDQKIDIGVESSASNDTKDKVMNLEKDDFIKNQIVEFNQPLTLYGRTANSFVESSTGKFQFEFSNFRILDKLPDEILKQKCLVGPNAFNADGSLKKENAYIVKVDFKVTNKNKEMAVTMLTGFSCYLVDEQYERKWVDNTNSATTFYESQKGSDGSVGFGYVKLLPDESYIDTVYFIIDKVTEDNCNLVIKVAPSGDRHQTVAGKSVTVYNNAYGFIKVNYSDIIWE